ncbi:hypothetical protein KA057_02585 [Candidatus Gracilibacteria bacterium]|nr:hypothetical protein [Candidatus Gracilibacteria bacterium]
MVAQTSDTLSEQSEATGRSTVPVIQITRDTSGNITGGVLIHEPMSDGEVAFQESSKKLRICNGIENLRDKPLDLSTYADISRDVVHGYISLNDLSITEEEFVAKRKVARIHNARERLLQAGNGTHNDIQVLIKKGYFSLEDLGMTQEEFLAGQKAAKIKDTLLQLEEDNNRNPFLYPIIFEQISRGEFTLEDLGMTQEEFIEGAYLSMPDKLFCSQ